MVSSYSSGQLIARSSGSPSSWTKSSRRSELSAIKDTNQILITLFVWPVHIPKCRCIVLGRCMKSKCGVLGDDFRAFWVEFFINKKNRKLICGIIYLAKDGTLHGVNHCMAKSMIKTEIWFDFTKPSSQLAPATFAYTSPAQVNKHLKINRIQTFILLLETRIQKRSLRGQFTSVQSNGTNGPIIQIEQHI